MVRDKRSHQRRSTVSSADAWVTHQLVDVLFALRWMLAHPDRELICQRAAAREGRQVPAIKIFCFSGDGIRAEA